MLQIAHFRQVSKVVSKSEAVKLSTNTLQNLSIQVDAVDKNRANQSQYGKGTNYWETVVEAEENTGLI